MAGLKSKMHENRGLTLAPSPLPESEPGTGPTGPESGTPGPTWESLVFPSKEEFRSRMVQLVKPLEPLYQKAFQSLMPQEQKSAFRLEDLSRPWPEITRNPFSETCETARTGWNQDRPDPKELEKSWQSQGDKLNAFLMRLHAQLVYEALNPETWNLWAIPVASYDRLKPLHWLHLRLPEGINPKENQSCLVADPWGEVLGCALVRCPPIRCRPEVVPQLAQDRWPLLLGLPQ